MLSDRFLSDMYKPGKDHGRTMVLDRLAPVDWDVISGLSPFIGYVKIGWTLPMLLPRNDILRRISQYSQAGISVSNGGTLLEVAVNKGRMDYALKSLKDAGFDYIELSEGVIDIPMHLKKRIAEFAHSNGMHLNVEVGKKNPRNQLSLDETMQKIEESKDFEPDFIIIEGRESGQSVEIFDDSGEIKWDWVNRIIEDTPVEKLMFEAPQEKQQVELVIRIGPSVNLGNVSMNSVGALETQRRGMRGDTFGILDSTVKVNGPPSNKFVYYVVANHGPIDQATIMELTGINRKTLQNALSDLLNDGLIRANIDSGDLRKKVYSLNTGLQ